MVNPDTGEVYATAALSAAEDVDVAYRAAETAFDGWRDSTPSERQRALLKFADAVEDHADELVALESENTGKPTVLTISEEIVRAWTRSGSSRAQRGSWRASRPASTWPGTRPTSGASPSAWSARWRPGTTR